MPPDRALPEAVRAERRAYALFFGALLLVVALCTWGVAFNPFELFGKGDAFWTFLSEDFWPPRIPQREGRLEAILAGIGVTFAMAVASATVAAVLAFLVALFASERVSPFPRLAPLVRGAATFVRNIPALVWAFILFSSLGIGTGVGFVALTLSSLAFLVRAFAETMEDLSQDGLESLLAIGATFPQRVAHGILPSCLGGFVSWYLYSLEVNIRASAVVGMVGGGGIGLVLFSYIKAFNYHVAFFIILFIAALVIAVDWMTGRLRKELAL